MKAFQYVYEHHLDDADWFMKADDDTFVDMVALRTAILPKVGSNDVTFLGYALKWQGKVWMSGGAGYLLSAKAFNHMIPFLKANEKALALKVTFVCLTAQSRVRPLKPNF